MRFAKIISIVNNFKPILMAHYSTLNLDDLSRFVISWFPKKECFDEQLEEIKSQWIETLKPNCNK